MQRGSFFSLYRGVNLLKTVPQARSYDLPDHYQPLRGDHMVQPAGMMSSVPCREPVFGPSRHCGASYTMATWLLRYQKPAQVADWGEGVGRGRGVEDREWRGNKFFEEDEGETRRMENGLGGEGGEVGRGRRQVRFLIKADHSHQP